MTKWKWDSRTFTAAGVLIIAVTVAVGVWERLGPAAQFLAAAVLVVVTLRYVFLTRELVATQREAVDRATRERHRVETLMNVNAVLYTLDSYLISHFSMWTGRGGHANVIRPRTRDYFESRLETLDEHAAGIAIHGPLLHNEDARAKASIVTRDLADLIVRARAVSEAFAQALETTAKDLTTFGQARQVYDEGPVEHDRKFDELLSDGALNGYRSRVADLQGQLLDTPSDS